MSKQRKSITISTATQFADDFLSILHSWGAGDGRQGTEHSRALKDLSTHNQIDDHPRQQRCSEFKQIQTAYPELALPNSPVYQALSIKHICRFRAVCLYPFRYSVLDGTWHTKIPHVYNLKQNKVREECRKSTGGMVTENYF